MKKMLWNRRTITNLVAGILFLVASITVIVSGQAQGLDPLVDKVEIYFRVILGLVFALLLICSPFCGILNIRSTAHYILFILGVGVLIVIAARFGSAIFHMVGI